MTDYRLTVYVRNGVQVQQRLSGATFDSQHAAEQFAKLKAMNGEPFFAGGYWIPIHAIDYWTVQPIN